MNHRSVLATSIALLGCAVTGAGAATSAATSATASEQEVAETGALQEVIVTSQKRAENLQEVPIAITAMNAEALAVHGVTDTDSIAKLVPNLHIKQGTTGVITKPERVG